MNGNGTLASGVAATGDAWRDDEELSTSRAILDRPRISIRSRIAAGFVLLFVFMAAITVAAIVFVTEVTGKLEFLEKAGNSLFEIEQARRFEKNFFLYGTNLADALTNVHTAQNEFEKSAAELRAAMGDERYEATRADLTAYEDLLYALDAAAGPSGDPHSAEYLSIEARLRTAGARILSDAEDMVDRQRVGMHTMLRTSMVVAVAFLGLMVSVMGLLGALLSHAVVAPLGRFVSYASRIGAGDYSPVRPARRFRDEFSDLAVAINHMLGELKSRQDQLLQAGKMAAVGTLTSGIAHELNNPLNNIGLTTESMIESFDEYPDETKVAMLGEIYAQVERASATVRNLLDFTRSDHPAMTSVAVGEILSSTLKLLGNELALGQVELHCKIGDDLPAVQANPRHLQQVFLNLLLNAVQAMPDGGTLTVRATPCGEGGVRVDVIDTGVGIPEENLGKIFDPFFTTKEPGQGTGLGLAVSFGIVERHGGRLTVASEVGAGTTFSVVLPGAAPRHGAGV